MSETPSFLLLTFSAIFFVVDPFAVIPMYLAITQGDSAEKKLATARRASIATTVTLISFAIAGGLIFRMFGITLGAFKIAGGILLFLMAVDMIRAQRSRLRSSPEEESEGVSREDVAIIPLAIPMLSGPGSIATVMVLMSRSSTPIQVAIVMTCIIVTGILTFLVLRAATMLERTLKNTGLNILTRLMGLILAAVAVQFVISGIQDSFPQLLSKM
ncbi:MAG: NAAT family transporter [Planctomycetes bacterium]|nr:NAAT family transporter [Planctomycetota bacterium]MBI3833637.1 NAAT family transporter [Planctomycetota bacterium]